MIDSYEIAPAVYLPILSDVLSLVDLILERVPEEYFESDEVCENVRRCVDRLLGNSDTSSAEPAQPVPST